MVLAESIGSHEPNVLHLRQDRPYGNLAIEIYSARGHERINVPSLVHGCAEARR